MTDYEEPRYVYAQPKMKGEVKERVVEKTYTLNLTEEQIARIVRLSNRFEGGNDFPNSMDPHDLRIGAEIHALFPDLYNKALKNSRLPWPKWKEQF